MEKERLQKFLANAGVASRRKCEELILEGRVSVNGEVVTELGTKIDPKLDKVLCNGKLVKVQDEFTSGALILTNDGNFVYKVTHPKHEITKTYTVTIKGAVSKEDVNQLKEGVLIDEYKTRPAGVRILKIDEEKDCSRLEIVIHEGKNRQVRKMCEAIGKKVLALHRAKIGPIGVKDLKIGTWRYLKDREIEELLK